MSEEQIRIDDSTEENNGSKYIIIREPKDLVQENLKVHAFNYGSTEKSSYIEFVLQNPMGQLVSKRQYITTRENAKSEESFKTGRKIALGLLANFARRFMGDHYVVEGSTMEQIYQKINKDCSPKFETTLLRVKLGIRINSGKYYTEIYNYGPFENMSKNPTELFPDPRDIASLQAKLALKATPDSSSTSTGDTETAKSDDLPF